MCFHLPSETTHIFDDYRSHSVAFDAIQECCKSRAILDSARPANGGVLEVAHEVETVPDRKVTSPRLLTPRAVLLVPNSCRAGRPEIGHCRLGISPGFSH